MFSKRLLRSKTLTTEAALMRSFMSMLLDSVNRQFVHIRKCPHAGLQQLKSIRYGECLFKYLALQMVNCLVNPLFMLECVGVLLETLPQMTIKL